MRQNKADLKDKLPFFSGMPYLWKRGVGERREREEGRIVAEEEEGTR